MDDFSALAQRVAVSVGDVRGCLILSRDGLVLGAYPEEDESLAKPAWLKFATLGEAEKSFVEFADQIWVFAHRGPYAAFAVAGTTVRPGVLLDTLEQALLVAEEARTKRESLKIPDVAQAPSGKPRTTLHPPADKPEQEPVPVAAGVEEAQEAAAGATAAAVEEVAAEPPATAAELPRKPPEPKLAGKESEPEEEGEVDRVMLAQEFSGLLQMEDSDDEGSS